MTPTQRRLARHALGLFQPMPAVTYWSGRRRYLTLKAACRDAARMRVYTAVRDMGDELAGTSDWWQPRVDRLARLYYRWAKVSLNTRTGAELALEPGERLDE